MIVTVLDEETTGKLDPAHRIIELSMRICNLREFREIKNVLMRFNPQRNIDAKAFAVHGIPLEDLKNEPLFADQAAKIAKVFEYSDYIVGHNIVAFDLPFLINEFDRLDIDLPDVKIYDTMIHGTFATDLGKSPNLQELCYSLDVDYDPESAHSGDYDTEVLRDALFNGVKLGWFKL